MRQKLLIAALCLAAATGSGCGSKSATDDQVASTGTTSSPAGGAKSVDPANAGSVKGKVTFAGPVPAPKPLPVKGNPECAVFHAGGEVLSEELLVKDGAVKNAFVYVKSGLEGYSFPAPTEPIMLDNKNCIYVPHVAGAQVGQPVVLLNSDPTLHNVHAYGKANKPFNIGLPFQGMKQTKKFTEPEVMVPMKCDVHPWMQGYLGILPHPYFAVTGDDGAFELKGVPAGSYTVEVWHEKLGTKTLPVTVAAGQAAEAVFDLTA